MPTNLWIKSFLTLYKTFHTVYVSKLETHINIAIS